MSSRGGAGLVELAGKQVKHSHCSCLSGERVGMSSPPAPPALLVVDVDGTAMCAGAFGGGWSGGRGSKNGVRLLVRRVCATCVALTCLMSRPASVHGASDRVSSSSLT